MMQRGIVSIGPFILWGLIALCVASELTLLASDHGLLHPARLRALAYDYFGFWPGVLRNWEPNYAWQPRVMFASYWLLHTGPIHLVVNMLTLWSLGRAVIDRVGPWKFLLLFLASALGGAVGFALLAETLRPMVGASGALFGLVGALLSWSYVDRFTGAASLWPVARAVAMLGLLNLVMWWAMSGLMAWQTHLGGFMTGWVMAMLIDPRSHMDSDSAVD